MALGAVARGDMVTAESHVNKALYRNPSDPYALYAAGVIYQNTGRPRKARQAYQELLSLDKDAPAVVAGPDHLGHKQLSDLAAANLKRLDTVTDREALGQEMVGQSLVPTGEPVPLAAPGGGTVERGGLISPLPGLNLREEEKAVETGGDAAVTKRFEIFRRLLNEGLVTEEEYQTRRAKNLGALLPLTKPAPGAGLERPVPGEVEISDRLKAIKEAFEIRAITAPEHAEERSMILDSLLPATPTNMAPPARPPSDLIEAGAMSGRLARLRAASLVSAEEMAREKSEIEKAVRGSALAGVPEPRLALPGTAPPSGSGKPAAKPPAKPKGKPKPAAKGSTRVAHLASYKSKAAAEAGWRELKAAFPDILGSLAPVIAQANLGAKGTFFRLSVGPMKPDAAQALCRKLAAKHQFCDTAP